MSDLWAKLGASTAAQPSERWSSPHTGSPDAASAAYRGYRRLDALAPSTAATGPRVEIDSDEVDVLARKRLDEPMPISPFAGD